MGRSTKQPIIYGFILACLLILASSSPIQAQSCPTPTEPRLTDGDRQIINSYAAVIGICGNTFEVNSPACFSEGDDVMIIQMQGATASYNETTESGTIEPDGYGSAGLYELNTIRSVSGNEVVFDRVVANEYDVGGKVQIVSIPNVGDLIPTQAYTCLAWNGTVGGVLAFTGGRITLGATIDVSGKGFRGGVAYNFTPTCVDQKYNYASDTFGAGLKGESINILPSNFQYGAARGGSGGGGGNVHNGGGGGGGNAGHGGDGGAYDRGGCYRSWKAIGGQALRQSTDRLHLGGSGGAGHANNDFLMSGGNGGGIVFIKAKSIRSSGASIRAKGENALGGLDWHDGGGGGGGGGAIVLDLESSSWPLRVVLSGGKGSDVKGNHGAGGGGGGGSFLCSLPSLGFITVDCSGGEPGFQQGDYKAQEGKEGKQELSVLIISSQENYISPAIISSQATPECDSSSTLVIDYESTNGQLFINDQPATGEVFTGLSTGSYQLTLTNGCDTVHEEITVQNYPILGSALMQAIPFICERPGALEVAQTGGKPPYVFTLNHSLSQSNGFFPGLGVGEYWITVADDLGCQTSQMVQIIDSSYTLFPLLPERVIEQRGETFELPLEISSPYPPIRYEWSPGEFFIDSMAAIPELLSPTQYNGAISLRVTDAVGCMGASGTEILITNPKFYVPTAFSPNGDDLNETLLFQSNPTLKGRMVEFRIFNRWGGAVYDWCEDADGEERRCVLDLFGPLNGTVLWDGFFLGTPAEVGAYPYHLVVELADSSRYNIKGITNLIR